MFDSRYLAYCGITALLVMSPGATMAVVLKAAVEEGRSAALFTVLGVNVGNSTLALASAFGMAILFAKWPLALHVVKACGAVYLTYLGVTGLGRAWFSGDQTPIAGSAVRSGRGGVWSSGAADLGGRTEPPLRAERRRSVARRASIVRGIMTNLLNPPVILFYMTFLPQFVGPGDPFLERFLVLAVTHISMSLSWLSIYAVSLGTLSDRLTRPGVRRAMETATGVALIGFGVRLFFR